MSEMISYLKKRTRPRPYCRMRLCEALQGLVKPWNSQLCTMQPLGSPDNHDAALRADLRPRLCHGWVGAAGIGKRPESAAAAAKQLELAAKLCLGFRRLSLAAERFLIQQQVQAPWESKKENRIPDPRLPQGSPWALAGLETSRIRNECSVLIGP